MGESKDGVIQGEGTLKQSAGAVATFPESLSGMWHPAALS